MSHPSMLPGAPDALSLLQQRLLQAEEEAEALIQDMGALGVSRGQILGSAQRMDATQCPVSPLKIRWVRGVEGTLWQHSDSLVSRMCRLESLLQTLKLTVFRLETERELDPCHTAHLKQQLAALQQESEEEHQASRREVMQLREQLQQVHHERDEARTELQRLGEAVEVATAAKMDVALAAEELKLVKSEMSQKLMEMKEQMRRESSRSAEAMKSHGELLRRFEELESVLETERRQALLLQSDCQVLHVQVRTSRQRLEEERDGGRQLEERCQLLGEQTAMKDSLVSELKAELKRQQTENGKLRLEGRELRAAAADREQAERSCAVKKLQEDAARRSIHTELQGALTDKVSLQLQLEKLKGERAQILQSSSAAQETAATQRELLERTIERLRGELGTAREEEEAARKDLEGSKNQLCLVVTKLESERSSLETQLSQAKREAGSLSSALHSQQEENRRLMGKMAALEQQQISELQALQGVSGPAGAAAVSQTFKNILDLHTGLSSQSLQQEPGGQEHELASCKEDRLQAQREIREHQAEVEKLQRLLTSTHSKNSRDLESLQKASDRAKVDNKRLAQSLEQAVSTNSSLHSKLEQAREQHRAAITLRDEDLREARTKILRLSEELRAVRLQTREDYESSMKSLQREVSELKRAVKDSSAGSGDLSEANQELRRLVSKQKARIREQRSQLRERRSRESHHSAQTFEERIRNLHESEPADSEHREVRTDSQQVSHKREADLERWTSTIRRWESRRELAHVAGRPAPARTQLTTQPQ